ncbi:hypothetical protein RCL1_008332 [Eukaryota sp. TZLM3-RCL]
MNTSNAERDSKVALSYVHHFDKQFRQLFPGRKKLYLTSSDESGVQRVLCSRLRPTQLPFPQFFTYDAAVRWLSDYLEISPLQDPTEPPSTIISPQTVLDTQKADSFSAHVLLASILLGSGYNCVVCHGYATKPLTNQSVSHVSCPDFSPSTPLSKVDSTNSLSSSSSSYLPPPRVELKSTYLEKHLAKQAQQVAMYTNVKEKEEEEEHDELAGLRVHSWVVVLPPSKNITKPIFLDVGVGRIFDPDDVSFDGVELVFNNENIWINLQSCENGCSDMSWNFSSPHWEQVFETEESLGKGANKSLLPAPVPIHSKLIMAQEKFEVSYPNQRKYHEFFDCFRVKWTERFRSDGLMVRHVSKDFSRLVDTFSNRVDGLIKRVIFRQSTSIFDSIIEESYSYSSVSGSLKVLKYYVKCSTLPTLIKEILETDEGTDNSLIRNLKKQSLEKSLDFDSSFRADGLQTYFESSSMSEYVYSNRKDGLSKRSLFFISQEAYEQERAFLPTSVPPISLGGNILRQMGLYFNPLSEPALPNDIVSLIDLDISCILIDLIHSSVHVTFHRRKNSLLHQSIEFPRLLSTSSNDSSSNYNDLAEFQLATKVKTIENNNLDFSRDVMTETENILHSLFNFIDESNSRIDLVKPKKISTRISVEKVDSKDSQSSTDFLTAFLPASYDPSSGPLSPRSAVNVRDQYLAAVGRRLVEKAAVVEARLEKEKGTLQKLQAQWRAKLEAGERSREEEEQIAACDMRIQVAQVRLNDIEQMATLKYQEEGEKLRNDVRLSNLPEVEKKNFRKREENQFKRK